MVRTNGVDSDVVSWAGDNLQCCQDMSVASPCMRRMCVCAGVPVEHGSIKVLCHLWVEIIAKLVGVCQRCGDDTVSENQRQGWPAWAIMPAHTDNPWFVLELQLCKGYGSANMHEQVCVHGYVPWDCWN